MYVYIIPTGEPSRERCHWFKTSAVLWNTERFICICNVIYILIFDEKSLVLQV